MTTALIAGVVLVGSFTIVAVTMLGDTRRSRQDEGIESFRRHIDALSTEARRDVHERARRHSAGHR